MYRLNLKNRVVNKFIDYYWAVVESIVKKENKIKEEGNMHSVSLAGAAPVSARNT